MPPCSQIAHHQNVLDRCAQLRHRDPAVLKGGEAGAWTRTLEHPAHSFGRRDMLKEKCQAEIDEILSRYPVKRSALLPLLYLAQREDGYVTGGSGDAGNRRHLEADPAAGVWETATFYTMLNLKPVGKFHLQVCKSLMCALVGSDTVIGWIGTKLGIKPGKRRRTSSSRSASWNVWPRAGRAL